MTAPSRSDLKTVGIRLLIMLVTGVGLALLGYWAGEHHVLFGWFY